MRHFCTSPIPKALLGLVLLGLMGSCAPTSGSSASKVHLVPGTEAQAAAPPPAQVETPSFPLPDGTPLPRLDDLGPEFRAPLPPSPVWNPPGAKRVGLQAGHWRLEETPPELARLAEGTSVEGWDEWEVNLRLAQHTAALLEAAGIVVDVFPAAPPVRYRAHAVVAIHADGNFAEGLRGYKVARSAISSVPRADDLLVERLTEAYGAATGLPRDDATIGESMTAYYAFDPRRFQHAIDVGVPAVILEAGYLTSDEDRALLTSQPEVAARGIADGIRAFLSLDLGPRAGGQP